MYWNILYNPLSKFSEKSLFVFGIVATFIGSFIGYYCGVTYDGVLDTHIRSRTFWESFSENLVNIASVFLALIILGKIINPKTRMVDVFNIAMLSRIPIYIGATFVNNPMMNNINQQIMESIQDVENLTFELMDLLFLIVFSSILLLLMVWQIILMIFGFRTATNLKKWQYWVVFGFMLILAEIFSKYLIGII
ncbi:MAG: hypothetical protein Q4G16_06640 [Cruoricaptor ignavus]|nr:hypothetical protein [Cruoricaptor ignavus]